MKFASIGHPRLNKLHIALENYIPMNYINLSEVVEIVIFFFI